MSKIKEEIVVIDNNRVYTSYYARACKILPNKRLVAISLGVPDYFQGEILRELNPIYSLLVGYKNRSITEEQYKDQYNFETLSKLNPAEIYNKLKGKVMLCHCGKDKFCHRHLVMEWLKENLGEEIIGNEI